MVVCTTSHFNPNLRIRIVTSQVGSVIMNYIDQAVILAGGKGERLQPLTDQIPKPMVQIEGKPFLDYLIHSLIEWKMRKILILTGYKEHVISQRYKNKINDKVSINYSDSGVDCETGKRLIDAYDLLDDTFLLVYGDTFCPLNLDKRIEDHFSKQSIVSMTIFTNKRGTAEYGYQNNTFVRPDGIVSRYDPSRENPDNNGVDIGYFIVQKSVLPKIASVDFSFQNDVIAPLCELGKVNAYWVDKQYYYLTDLESVNRFKQTVVQLNLSSVKL